MLLSFLVVVFAAAAQTEPVAPTTMSGNIISKTGAANARVWTLTITNNGPAAANSLQMNSFNLTQTAGAACTPVITPPSTLPLNLGGLAPGGSTVVDMTIDFTGCAANARFTAMFTFSANDGAVTGTVVRYNQFR
jgi:hypothetical protein